MWYHCRVVQGRELHKMLSSLQQERTFAKGVKAAKGTQAFQFKVKKNIENVIAPL